MFLLTDQGQHPIFLLLYPTGAKITGRHLFNFILDSIFQWEIKDDLPKWSGLYPLKDEAFWDVTVGRGSFSTEWSISPNYNKRKIQSNLRTSIYIAVTLYITVRDRTTSQKYRHRSVQLTCIKRSRTISKTIARVSSCRISKLEKTDESLMKPDCTSFWNSFSMAPQE